MAEPAHQKPLQAVAYLMGQINERGGTKAVLPDLMDLDEETRLALLVVSLGLLAAGQKVVEVDLHSSHG